MGVVESQLSGGDFLCDIDYRRADEAGSSLRALFRPPASTTVAYLARRFGDKQLAGLENAVGILARRSFEILPENARSRLLACRPSIDLDPTDVEVYGRKKRGFAFNCAGQLTGRPHPAIFAEAGLVLAGDLGSGTNDPRPQAPSLIARAIAALPTGLDKAIVRADPGFFDAEVATATLGASPQASVGGPLQGRIFPEMVFHLSAADTAFVLVTGSPPGSSNRATALRWKTIFPESHLAKGFQGQPWRS